MSDQINRGSPSYILEHRIKSVVVVVAEGSEGSTCCNKGYGLIVTFFRDLTSMQWGQNGKHALTGNMQCIYKSSRVNGDSLVITSDVQSMISCVSISLDSMILWACAGSNIKLIKLGSVCLECVGYCTYKVFDSAFNNVTSESCVESDDGVGLPYIVQSLGVKK